MHNHILRASRTIGIACAVWIAAACTRSDDKKSEQAPRNFEIHDAWVRAVDSGATTAAYMRLVNGSSDRITVSSFTTDAAATVELHESMTDEHMTMHMMPRTDLLVEPKGSAILKPAGLHLMLINTTRPLTAGTRVRIVMRLSNGSIVSTSADVRAP